MNRFSCLLVVLALWTTWVLGAGINADILPAETTGYMTINTANILKNKLVQRILNEAAPRAELEKTFSPALLDNTSATLVTFADGENLLGYLETPGSDLLVEALKKDPTYVTVTSGARTIHCWTIDLEKAVESVGANTSPNYKSAIEKLKQDMKGSPRQPGYLVVEKSGLVVFSTEMRTLHVALDVLDKKKPSLAQSAAALVAAPPQDAGLFIFASFTDPKGTASKNGISLGQGARISCGEQNGNMYVHASMDESQEGELLKLKAVVEGFKAMFQLSLGGNPEDKVAAEVVAVVNAFGITVEKKTLKLDWEYPAAKLEMLIQQATNTN